MSFVIEGNDGRQKIWLMWAAPDEPIGWTTSLREPDGSIDRDVVLISEDRKYLADRLAVEYGGTVVEVTEEATR